MPQSLLNAVKTNNLTLAQQLITQGADVNETDASDNSLLIVSAADGHPQMVELLLDAGADIHAVDASMKATALHAAAYLKHPAVMQVLVDRGVKIDAQGPYNGYTALHDAVWQNNVAGVKILLAAGADTTLKGKNGKTPLDLAKSSGHTELITLLQAT